MSATHPILRLLSTDPKLVVGLACGAARGDVDAVLVEIQGHGATARARLLRSQTTPLPPGVREAVEAALDPDHATTAAELSTLNFRLGAALGEAAAAIAGDDRVDLVASHGATVWHQPPWMKSRGDLIASMLQLGEPAVVAARTGVVTVADFGVADMAVGGAGGPLGPYADWVLFREPGRVRALQDIGGVAGVTVVGDRLEDVLAFDNGPGELFIEALVALAGDGGGEEDDGRAGARATEGNVLADVLAELLEDDYLGRPPPKSTGRERYGRTFVERLRARHPRRRPIDLLATGVAFVAEAIAASYRAFVLPRAEVAEILVSGGGAHEGIVMEQLARLCDPVPVRAFEHAGIPGAAKEAVSFALLGVEAIHGAPANVVAATGARRPAVLGRICLPPA